MSVPFIVCFCPAADNHSIAPNCGKNNPLDDIAPLALMLPVTLAKGVFKFTATSAVKLTLLSPSIVIL